MPGEESDRSGFPELISRVVEYEEGGRGVACLLSGLQLATGPERDDARDGVTYIFLVDGNLSSSDLASLARSIGDSLQLVSGKDSLALLVFTGVVTLYELSPSLDGEIAKGHVLSGIEVQERAGVENVLEAGANYVVSAKKGVSKLIEILGLLRGASPARRGSRSRGRWHTSLPLHRRKRALGAAVQYALGLAQQVAIGTKHGGTRILVCLGGCPNVGPGALLPCLTGAATACIDDEVMERAMEYFEGLSCEALQLGAGIDVFCSSNDTIGVKALQALCTNTGGYVILGQGFGKPFAATLSKSLLTQKMSSNGDSASGCVIDVRHSEGAVLSRVIGPVSVTNQRPETDQMVYEECVAAAAAAEGRWDSIKRAGAVLPEWEVYFHLHCITYQF
ncbi:unnamed protein product [Chrysoparadoxa australica]